MFVLAWIRGDVSRWQTFVSNGAAEIQRTTKISDWNHVPTKTNPADILSRGYSLSELKDSRLWWNGPSWLEQDEDSWPSTDATLIDVPEMKKLSLTFTAVEEDSSILKKFSCSNKLRRVIAYCLRFKTNALNKSHGTTRESEQIT